MPNTQPKLKQSHFRSWKSGKSWLFAATVFAVLAGTSMLTPANAVKVQAASTSSLVSVIRMYNPTTGEHLLSTDPNEQTALASAGWKNEGVNFVEPTSGVSVHRLYNPTTGAHLYSEDTTEIAHLAANGWNDEGNDFYAPSSGAYPVVRLYNPTTNQHVWSTDPHEQSVLTSGGAWKAEGTAFYAASYTAVTTETQMNLAEIAQGNFESIQGTWKNNEGQQFTISGSNFSMNGTDYTLTVEIADGKTSLAAQPTTNNGGGINPYLTLYPAGSAIPVYVNGKIDTSGTQDITNKSLDRIMNLQSQTSPQEAANQAFYRK